MNTLCSIKLKKAMNTIASRSMIQIVYNNFIFYARNVTSIYICVCVCVGGGGTSIISSSITDIV